MCFTIAHWGVVTEKGSHKGAMIGAIVGSVIAVCIAIVVAILYVRRSRAVSFNSSSARDGEFINPTYGGSGYALGT